MTITITMNTIKHVASYIPLTKLPDCYRWRLSIQQSFEHFVVEAAWEYTTWFNHIKLHHVSFIVRRCWKISLTRVWMARWFSSRFGHTTSPPDGMLPKPEPIHAEIGLISLAEVCNFPKQLMNHLTLCTNLVWTGIIWQLLCSDQCYFLPQEPVLYWYSESR